MRKILRFYTKDLFVLIFCIIGFSSFVFGQEDSLSLDFKAIYNGQNIDEFENDSIGFEILKLYLGNFILMDSKGDKIGFHEGYKLYDFFSDESQEIKIHFIGKPDRLLFDIGTDSLSNVSGALGGDLDPMFGMYWTWQSGYINFKCEGFHPKSKNRDKSFAFHLGGFLAPYQSWRYAEISIQDERQIVITINMNKLLDSVDWNMIPNIMSPSSRSVEMCNVLPEMFTIQK